MSSTNLSQAEAIHQLVEQEFYSNPMITKRYRCPECSDNRSNKNRNEKCLSVRYEESEAVYFCHHCETKGKVVMNDSLPEVREIRTAPNFSRASQEFLESVLTERSIPLDSLPPSVRKTLLHSDDVYFRDIGGKSEAIGFSYSDQAIKWRSTKEKQYTQTGNCNTLYPHFGSDHSGPVVLVEGEWDALALISCGYEAYSVPKGANISRANADAPAYLKPIITALANDEIDVIVAVDADKKGKQFGDGLMNWLGRRRVGVIDWSKYGVKDANECLSSLGSAGIRSAFQEVQNILYEGIVRVSAVAPAIDQIRIGGFTDGAKIGIPNVDKLITFCSDQISVVTGVPGSGKSEFIDFVMIRLAMQHQWKFGIFSAENPIPIHAGKLMEKYIGKPLFEGERMPEEDVQDASDWMEKHFFFLDPAKGSTLDSILQRAAVLVEHERINGLLIDPFNYTDVSLETEAISAMLTKLHLFAKEHHIHIWIVAHPQKMYREKGKLPVPGGYDISGSAAWYAKADFGYTLSRNDEGETVLTVWKVRFKWLGETGTANMRWDPKSGRYSQGTTLVDINRSLSRIAKQLPTMAVSDSEQSEKEETEDVKETEDLFEDLF